MNDKCFRQKYRDGYGITDYYIGLKPYEYKLLLYLTRAFKVYCINVKIIFLLYDLMIFFCLFICSTLCTCRQTGFVVHNIPNSSSASSDIIDWFQGGSNTSLISAPAIPSMAPTLSLTSITS